MLRRAAPLLVASALVLFGHSAKLSATPSSSAALLVQQGKASEAGGDDHTAIKRYGDALIIDPSSEEAYLALALLREKRGELTEADDVCTVGLTRAPVSVDLFLARGRIRRELGEMTAASDDLRRALVSEGATGSSREIAILRERIALERERAAPAAQLGAWRRLLVIARATHDAALEKEASVQARALGLYVGDVDPVLGGRAVGDPLRSSLWSIARRGG